MLDALVRRVPYEWDSTPPRKFTYIFENSASASFADGFHKVSFLQNDTDHLMLIKDTLWDLSTPLRRLSKKDHP